MLGEYEEYRQLRAAHKAKQLKQPRVVIVGGRRMVEKKRRKGNRGGKGCCHHHCCDHSGNGCGGSGKNVNGGGGEGDGNSENAGCSGGIGNGGGNDTGGQVSHTGVKKNVKECSYIRFARFKAKRCIADHREFSANKLRCSRCKVAQFAKNAPICSSVKFIMNRLSLKIAQHKFYTNLGFVNCKKCTIDDDMNEDDLPDHFHIGDEYYCSHNGCMIES